MRTVNGRYCSPTAALLVSLAAAVHARGVSWALEVPTDGDPEWVVRLGTMSPPVECVAGELDEALAIALDTIGGAS